MGTNKAGSKGGKGGARPKGDEILHRKAAIVPDSAKLDPMPLPTREALMHTYDPMVHPIIAIACYLHVRGHSREALKWFDLVRGPTSMFRNGDDLWARNLIALGSLFAAGFNRQTFEAAYPDVKAKADAAMAALVADQLANRAARGR